MPTAPSLPPRQATAYPSLPPDPHLRVTAALLAQLETTDPASWTPPWQGADPLPRNALTGARYRGVNILALWAAAQINGYSDPRWATYRQWAALGAQVRRGERGTAVLFYRDLPTDSTGTAADSEVASRFVARTSTVFNAERVDGASDLDEHLTASEAEEPQSDLDDFLLRTGARLVTGGTRASYNRATDTLHLPARRAFLSSEAFAATLAHELIHWTGAPHRLARDLSGRFGSHAYAAEELVAEIGAAFVLADLGLARAPHPGHAAYCAGWLPLLRAEPQALSVAARLASQAATYLASVPEQDVGGQGRIASTSGVSWSEAQPPAPRWTA